MNNVCIIEMSFGMNEALRWNVLQLVEME